MLKMRYDCCISVRIFANFLFTQTLACETTTVSNIQYIPENCSHIKLEVHKRQKISKHFFDIEKNPTYHDYGRHKSSINHEKVSNILYTFFPTTTKKIKVL